MDLLTKIEIKVHCEKGEHFLLSFSLSIKEFVFSVLCSKPISISLLEKAELLHLVLSL